MELGLRRGMGLAVTSAARPYALPQAGQPVKSAGEIASGELRSPIARGRAFLGRGGAGGDEHLLRRPQWLPGCQCMQLWHLAATALAAARQLRIELLFPNKQA